RADASRWGVPAWPRGSGSTHLNRPRARSKGSGPAEPTAVSGSRGPVEGSREDRVSADRFSVDIRHSRRDRLPFSSRSLTCTIGQEAIGPRGYPLGLSREHGPSPQPSTEPVTMKVVLAEKPSVARELASFLGATSRRDGYLEGRGYQVTWALGHLAALKEPEDYDPALHNWSLPPLPFV